MAEQFHVGQRLSYSRALCTVKYIGSVEGTRGEWLGVEWDDVQRGKHSGEREGKKYFECLIPKAGSFIRPTRVPDPSISFLEALRNKYASGEDPLQHPAISISATKVIEEVGFDKIAQKLSHLRDLKIILLDGWAINSANDEELIRETCPNIEELDLSRNCFEKLEDVVNICAALPKLTALRISGNRFSSFDLPPGPTPFQYIKSLEINNVLMSWQEITDLLSHFSSVTTILMQHNNLSEFPTQAPFPQSLQALDLSNNIFTSLTALPPLSPLPSLETLILSHNPVATLSVLPPEKAITAPITFPALKRLDIAYAAIPNFEELDNLFHPPYFPSLTALRVSHSLLYANIPWEEAHMLTVARLPANVTSLNQSTITLKERENAEMWYLSRIAKVLAESDASEIERAEILGRHKRWDELCELHGTPVTAATMAVNDKTLSGRLLQLEFISPAKTITKKLPRATAVSTLRGLVGRWYGLDPLSVNLRIEGNVDRETVTLGEDEGIREIGMWIEHGAARVFVEAS